MEEGGWMYMGRGEGLEDELLLSTLLLLVLPLLLLLLLLLPLPLLLLLLPLLALALPHLLAAPLV